MPHKKTKTTFWIILAVLVAFLVLGPALANDDDRLAKEDSFLEEVSEGLGVVSLWGLVFLNALHYYGMALRRLPKGIREILPHLFKKPLQWKGRFRHYHYWGNPVIIGIGYLHGIWAEESNLLLWAGWGLLVLLTISGLIMKLQKADLPGAKIHRLIHTQHTLSVAMVVLLWIGHLLAD